MSEYNCADDMELFFKRLPRQYGSAITPDGRMYFAGSRRQRGSGLGGVFSSFARRLIPFAQRFILPHAVSAIQSIASELGSGRSFKDSVKENSMRAFKSAGRDYFNQSGSGVSRRKITRRTAVKIKGPNSKYFYACNKKRKKSKPKSQMKKKKQQENRTIFH